jgi:SAM-dependent methyltransferase
MNVATTVKAAGQHILKKFGLYLTHGPTVSGSKSILGSFAPYDKLNTIGGRSDYFIHDGYEHRSEPRYLDTTSRTDEWQDEVYRFAREIADQFDLKSVIDIGCGSGFKLLKYFRNHATIGVDVHETCALLRKRYPSRQWTVSEFSDTTTSKADLVIASDVIEHVPDPDAFLQYILRIAPRYVILSTPDRNLLRSGTHNGPPLNPAHMREWSMAELHAYLSVYLEIDEHFISCAAQATQCVLARPRSLGAS